METQYGRIPRLLAEFTFPEQPAVKEAYMYIHHRNDLSGRLIYIDRVRPADGAVALARHEGGDPTRPLTTSSPRPPLQ